MISSNLYFARTRDKRLNKNEKNVFLGGFFCFEMVNIIILYEKPTEICIAINYILKTIINSIAKTIKNETRKYLVMKNKNTEGVFI